MTIRVAGSLLSGKFHIGFRGLGVLGSEIASTGTDGPGFGYPSVDIADANAELWFQILTQPTGTLVANEDTSFTYTGPVSSFTFRKWRNGADMGMATATLNIGITEGPVELTPVRYDFPASYVIYAAATEPPSGITSVTVSPRTVALEGGTVRQFNVVVQGTADFNPAVVWTASDGLVNAFGTFTAPDATAVEQEIFLRATSVQDPDKWDEIRIIVLAKVIDEVTSVQVSPQNAQMDGNAQLQLEVVVNGPGSPSQDVFWEVTAGGVNQFGLFTAPAAELFKQIVFARATSKQDPSKWGETSITVLELPPPVEIRTVSLVLGTENGPASNLTGLMVSFHAASGPHASNQALYQSSNGTTDDEGRLTFSMQTSRLVAGDFGLLSVLMPNGRHYLGLVAVA